MDTTDIHRALLELGRRLDEQGLTGELYIVGGAAIALAFNSRRTTRDIAAVFEPKAAIYAIAEQMSNDLGLANGWLNDGVKGFLAGPDPGAQVVLEAPGIRCSLGSPRMLLALKVLAHREGEDEDDVLLLADALGLDSARAVLDVATAVFGDRLDVAARSFVEEIFPPE